MIFKSPYPDIAIPEVPLADYILERAPQFAAKPALIDGVTGRTLTYAELVEFQIKDGSHGILVNGTLDAEGTDAQHIRFTRLPGSATTWKGLTSKTQPPTTGWLMWIWNMATPASMRPRMAPRPTSWSIMPASPSTR